MPKVQKNTKNINPVKSKARNGKTMRTSKCAICGAKKSRFIKKQEVKGLLTSLDFKTGAGKIPILWRLSFLSATPLNAVMYETMLSYCLKCKKILKTLIQQF